MAMPESYNVSARLTAEFNRATEKKKNMKTMKLFYFRVEIKQRNLPHQEKFGFTALFARLMETKVVEG
jgi:hypothetical protein